MGRASAGLLWVIGAALLVGCEDDGGCDGVEIVQQCEPGAYQCAGDGYIQQCDEDGLWGGRQPFLCVTGQCMIVDGDPVCM